MPSDDLIRYFMEQANNRFDSIENKVDRLVSFRWLLIGISIGVSGLVSFIAQVAQAMMK